MTAIPKPRRLTVAEYLAIEKNAEFKSEFHDGVMYPLHPAVGPRMMAGATREHNTIFANLFVKLGVQLEGGPCRLFAANQRVRVERTGLYTYPDIVIVCGPPEYASEDRDTLINPKVVIEVLSDSTEKYDRTTKFRHYQQLPSVMEYVLVAQDEPVIERYVRLPEGIWGRADFVGMDASLTLASVSANVKLADIYLGVEFPAPSRPASTFTNQP